MAKSDSIFKDSTECVYTTCYCEENVWKLCDYIRSEKAELLPQCFCVFISNKERKIPLWCQQSSHRADGLVVWDYHVIFVYNDGNEQWVYDLDTTLPFPCTFKSYTESALHKEDGFKQEMMRYFRVINAETYIKTFASDRSHMVNKQDGTYLSSPPKYPPIKTQDETNNVQDFISMEPETGFGTVLNCLQFFDKCFLV